MLKLESITDIIQAERNNRWRTDSPYCKEVKSKLLGERGKKWREDNSGHQVVPCHHNSCSSFLPSLITIDTLVLPKGETT